MNHFFIKILLIVPLLLSANEPPNGYYASANGLSGQELKSALNNIIKNHIEFEYTSSDTDVWDILKETDKDPQNPNNVILIYSGVSVNAAKEFNFTNGWIREHVWAKSRGEFGSEIGPGTDVHALRPLDFITNTERNNKGFDNCVDCSDVFDRWGNNTGSKKDDTNYSFEPRDEVKGDVARMLFYMATRYEGDDGYVDLELIDKLLPLGDNTPYLGVTSTLLEWNKLDPVSEFEKNRNEIIYTDYQKNRNPFIDHPELADHIWGVSVGMVWNPEILSIKSEEMNSIAFVIDQNVVKIQDQKNSHQWQLFDLSGRLIKQGKNSEIPIEDLKPGVYFLRVAHLSYKFLKNSN